MLVAHPKTGIKSASDLVRMAKAQPGRRDAPNFGQLQKNHRIFRGGFDKHSLNFEFTGAVTSV